MIKLLLLYYFSVKPTHGYEIQRFIQVYELDKWAKIQSGSIYYALAKLEKEGLIQQTSVMPISDKQRKEYCITARGREALPELARQCLETPIGEAGSDKFFMFPILSCLESTIAVMLLNAHIEALEKKRDYITHWQKMKINNRSFKTEIIAFEMMLSSYDYQIKWHKAMLEELNSISKQRGLLDDLIRMFSFNTEKQ